MKRPVLFMMAGIIVLLLAYIVWAEEHPGKMITEMTSPKNISECPICPLMCKSMMSKKLVATEDGGVIVLAGCRLIKYDKDLNKVKDVEIEMDMAKMKEKMQCMMKDCPMCCPMKKKEMMQK